MRQERVITVNVEKAGIDNIDALVKMSPAFINGRTGTVLNVYTCPEYRHRGYAKMIMKTLLAEAEKLQLSVVDLKSTVDGYQLYKSVGFADDRSKYHLMKWKPGHRVAES